MTIAAGQVYADGRNGPTVTVLSVANGTVTYQGHIRGGTFTKPVAEFEAWIARMGATLKPNT